MGKKNKGNRPQPALGGLADAFVKAGLASEKEADKARNERRRERKELGADGIAKREHERRERHELVRRESAEASRARALGERDQAATERVQRAIRDHRETGRGRSRWFFVARDGRIPFVDVNDGVARALADGTAGIVETLGVVDGEHAVIGDVQALVVLRDHDPDVVRFWNQTKARS